MSDAPAIVLIANPTSGRGRAVRMAERVAERLRERHTAAAVRYTDQRGAAETIALAELARTDGALRCLVACGGDGTLQEIANALASTRSAGGTNRVVLGIAPAGRCNDFARALGIRRDADDVVETLLNGEARAIDLGRVNGRYFCTVATAGIDAEVSRFVDEMRMPLKGTIAYLYGAMRVLLRYRAPHVSIEADFGSIEGPVFLASSANTSSYGGAIPIAPGAIPTDGVLTLCVIRKVSLARALTLVPQVLRGRHASAAEVRLVSTKHFTMTSPQRLELWADGEPVGTTPATIEVAPAAVSVMLPPGHLGR